MPQSSVFLRLQWPSASSSESSHEASSVLSSSSCSSVENSLRAESPPQAPMRDPFSERNKSAVRGLLPLGRSRSSPIVSQCRDVAEEEEDTSGSSVGVDKRKKKPRVKLRDRRNGEARARRMARSLSASSTSVSTSTDPEDFFYASVVASSSSVALPSDFDGSSSRIIVPTSRKAQKEPIESSLVDALCPLRIDASDRIPYSDRGETVGQAPPPRARVAPSPALFIKKLKNKAISSLVRKRGFCTNRRDALESLSRGVLQPLEEAAEEESVPDLISDCNKELRHAREQLDISFELPRLEETSFDREELAQDSFELPQIKVSSFQREGVGAQEDSFELARIEGASFERENVTQEQRSFESPEVEDGGSFDCEGAADSPPRTLKKTVTFLLPPEYCDSSFISEEGETASGEYPPSGYAELDGSLLPPNGSNPYRNTPSPGFHGIPNDRYDGVYEGETFLPDQPDDGGFRAGRDFEGESFARERDNSFRRPEDYPRGPAEGPPAVGYSSVREMEPFEGDVYGHLKQPERPSYTLNGVLSSHHGAHPLHSYEEDGLQRTSAATTPLAHPSPQMSIPNAPLLPPHTSPGPQTPTHNNHDTYAPPSLLRSPSADSTSRVRWRDPDLHEVIDFLSNPNNIVKANAAAYLQHLCYMDDATKQKTRILGGIPPLVALLSHDLPELHRNACGALRNLSYGRQNDENKRAIKEAGGLPTLVRLLRKTLDNEVKELVTGILWNLSSCEDLKQSILDEALGVLSSHVIIPCSGWDGGEVERDPNNDVWWSTVFKNASGIIRNISSAGEYARTKLRHCPGLVDSLFCVIKLAIQGNSHDNKSVENCVCILRNLSYRCQEVEDPNYDKNQPPSQSRATATGKEGEEDGSDKCGDNLGCFGGSRKKKEMAGGQLKDLNTGQRSTGTRGQTVRGMELLWQPDLVVQPYLALLSDCSNPETLEAAAGAIQNLAACYWQPSIDVRAAVRKEKGLPILVELLRMEVDRVVCAVATALRNLAIDQRNKELIGKYAMRDLVQKLPSQSSHDTATSDETIAAVLATLNEVIKKNAEFSRSLLDAGGVDRLVYITRQRGRYSTRVIKFASQVLFSMWGHQELREVYKKSGWKEQDFVSKSVAARNAAGANSPTANNTLNRPMASQGGTRYEDRTIQRSNNQAKHLQYQRREEVPLADLGYGGDGGALGGVRIYGPVQANPGEPVYAKVNRDKKRPKQYDTGGLYGPITDEWGNAPPAYSTIDPNPNSSNYSEPHLISSPSLADAANNNEIPQMACGDSWV